MELYGKVLLWAMPAFLILVFLEKIYGLKIKRNTYDNMDMISSLSSGITNVTKDVLGLSIALLTYKYMVEHWALMQLPSTFFMGVVAFICLDFKGYWTHRLAHRVNLFWNKHLIHHSSEEFNLACALRQTVSVFVNLFTFFLLPAALMGVPFEIVAIIGPIHLFAQFWYHTEHINKLGFLEHVIVTPSHHRVHHAINPEYLDKNFAEIFIVWDKLFGTFQAELPNVKPVYGITRPVRTWNPIKINFQHLSLLFQDAWYAESWWDKVRIWFMPTGWRPADVAQRFPVFKIENVYDFDKYRPATSRFLQTWSWLQLFFTFSLVYYFFGNIARIQPVHDIFSFFNSPNLLLYGFFIFISVYAYTEMMDANRYAFYWELFKNMIGLGIIYTYGDWFEMNEIFSLGTTLIAIYFIVATGAAAYFQWFETQKKS
jgi:alkylglycerol monooxygenase